jgi:hypothetical protein
MIHTIFLSSLVNYAIRKMLQMHTILSSTFLFKSRNQTCDLQIIFELIALYCNSIFWNHDEFKRCFIVFLVKLCQVVPCLITFITGKNKNCKQISHFKNINVERSKSTQTKRLDRYKTFQMGKNKLVIRTPFIFFLLISYLKNRLVTNESVNNLHRSEFFYFSIFPVWTVSYKCMVNVWFYFTDF